MTASERIDEVETSLAETNAALAELRRMTEEKKSELENVILRESLATSNERYTTLKTEQDAALQRMSNAQNESAKRIENALNSVSENVRRMSAALSESVDAAVSRVSQPLQSSARVISAANEEAAKKYAAMFEESRKANAAEFKKLMDKRNAIDILVLVVAVFALLTYAVPIIKNLFFGG